MGSYGQINLELDFTPSHRFIISIKISPWLFTCPVQVRAALWSAWLDSGPLWEGSAIRYRLLRWRSSGQELPVHHPGCAPCTGLALGRLGQSEGGLVALDFLTAPVVCTWTETTFLLDKGHVNVRTWERSSLQLSLLSSSPLFVGVGKSLVKYTNALWCFKWNNKVTVAETCTLIFLRTGKPFLLCLRFCVSSPSFHLMTSVLLQIHYNSDSDWSSEYYLVKTGNFINYFT